MRRAVNVAPMTVADREQDLLAEDRQVVEVRNRGVGSSPALS